MLASKQADASLSVDLFSALFCSMTMPIGGS
ncbi:hypothetical protein U062_02235 [Gammaproteobacteria bacterium MOLA455]|nr:hypothetical protein U062_02235 [Gammaproteobacteria bacterium MOLA455]